MDSFLILSPPPLSLSPSSYVTCGLVFMPRQQLRTMQMVAKML